MENSNVFRSSNDRLLKYKGFDETVIVPKGYITIAKGAFKGNATMKEIVLPDGVSEIGWNAFEECINLVKVNLPDTINTIEDLAFINCRSLESITIPCNTTKIGESAFRGCSSLNEVFVLNDNVEIGHDAFDKCKDVVIFCSKNSSIHTYARENGIKYKLLNCEMDDIDDTNEEHKKEFEELDEIKEEIQEVDATIETSCEHEKEELQEQEFVGNNIYLDEFKTKKNNKKYDNSHKPDTSPNESLFEKNDDLFTDEEMSKDTYHNNVTDDKPPMSDYFDEFVELKKTANKRDEIEKVAEDGLKPKPKPNPKRRKTLSFAVTSSGCDDIGSILDSLNIKYDSYKEKGFDCDYLYINCLTRDNIPQEELNNYVKQGGCLYASCYADRIINKAFGNVLETKHLGKPHVEDVLIEDEELKKIMGNHMNVTFDTTWAKLYSARGSTSILKFSQDEQNPIMISLKYGKGIIFYTCFHNHIQMTNKENMLLQFLVLRQIGIKEKVPIDEVGDILGINIEKIKKQLIE